MFDIIYYASAVLTLCAFGYIASYYLQLNRYEVFSTIKSSGVRLLQLILCFLLVDAIENVLLLIIPNVTFDIVCLWAGYVARLIIGIVFVYRSVFKNALRFTPRVWRQSITIVLLYCAAILLVNKYVGFVVHIAIALLAFIVGVYISKIVEYLIGRRYIKLTKSKLAKHPNMRVVGITGSYGKTSTKQIIYQILKQRFVCKCTPKSYNTPMGICKYIREENLSGVEYLIIEMGATRVGDISKICSIVDPDIAVLTSIGAQHLESFKSVTNVAKTKGELVCHVAKKKGIIISNFNNAYCIDVCKVAMNNLYGVFVNYINNVDNKNEYIDKNICKNIYNINILNMSQTGTKFYIYDTYNNTVGYLSTALLGLSSVTNISLAVALALQLGVAIEDISTAVECLQPVSNRLELKTGASGADVIMNAYNSNIHSFREMLSVASLFSSQKKILITPGLVELGKIQFEENCKIAREAKLVFDEIWVINQLNKNAFVQGVGEGSKCKIICYDRLDKIVFDKVDRLGSDTLAVFENDLPDVYK